MEAARAMNDQSSEEGRLLAVEEAGQSVAVRGQSRWRYLPLMAMGALAAVAAVAAAASAVSPRKATAVSPSMEFQGKSKDYAASMSCYSFTGGTCSLNACDKWRGASCSASGNCVCEAGCAGSDGKCHNGQTNTLVSSEFTLTNVKWTKYSMYFQGLSAMNQMKTSKVPSFMNLGKDKFSLYKLPVGNETKFMLGSMAYPSEVARIGATVGTSVNLYGFYATDMQKGKGPDVLAVSACYDKTKKALMFANKEETKWAYVKRSSWFVYAYSGAKCKVGDGGLWKADPPFDARQIAQLPACNC